MKTCLDCKYSISFGYRKNSFIGGGGFVVDCLMDLNPVLPDLPPIGESAIEFANRCEKFTLGACVVIDSKQTKGRLENYSDDDSIKELLRNY